MSQEYDDNGSSELIEWRVGVPLVAASFLIGIRIVEGAISKTQWTLDRAFRLSLASVFLVLVLWSWRIIRKDLKTFTRLCRADGKPGIDTLSSQSLRKSVLSLVSLYSSVIVIILLALVALQKI